MIRCTYCGGPSDRGMIRACRSCSGLPVFKCFACGTKTRGRTVDRATNSQQLCKGYCYDDKGCPGRACPKCGRRHYWTGSYAAKGGPTP